MKGLTLNIKTVLYLTILIILWSVNTFGQTPQTPQKIVAPDGNANDYFGFNVAIDGNRAIVGAHGAGDVGTNKDQGFAYIFVKTSTGWILEDKLTPPNSSIHKNFGVRVSISGDTVAVSSYRRANQYQDGIHIYVRDGSQWTHQKTISAPQHATTSLETQVHNDTLVVNFGIGVYIYTRDGVEWTHQQTILANDGNDPDGEPYSLNLWGETLIIGARGSSVGEPTAYIYKRSGTNWNRQAKIKSNSGLVNDRFAYSVSIEDDLAVVSAENDVVGSNDKQGSVYIYKRLANEWLFQQKLTASDGTSNNYFGRDVKIFNGKLYISSADIVNNSQNEGKIYVYKENQNIWTEDTRYEAPMEVSGVPYFGSSIDLDNSLLLVGNYANPVNGNFYQGAAYLYSIDSNPTNCNYQISPSSINLNNSSQNSSFNITTTSECSWTATSNESWITTTSTGNGNGTITFSVAPNSGQSRIGSISVGGQTFTVNQSGDSTIDGSNITNINADNITSGTLADERLSSNVATLSGSQTFTGAKTFNGGIFGDGSGLTNLNASNITSGILDNSRLGLIPTANIADSAITSSKIANNQVVRSFNGLTDNVNLVAGSNITITPSGNDLTISSVINNGNFIQNTSTQQANSNFNISGNGTVGGVFSSSVVNATTQFNLGGSRILTSNPSNFNLFVGTSGYSNTSGINNSFFGTISGNNNTTGSYNSFLGVASGYSNTSGERNVFIGSHAGYKNTTGSANSFIGFESGYENISSTGNTFMGSYSGRQNTTGNYNSFFGLNSGRSNTIGTANSFLGVNAGFSNTTGNSNTFVGFQSGFGNTTGINNSFLGQDSGKGNTTGSHNSFFGFQAGASNESGIGNTFMGENSGYYNVAGNYNSFYGVSSGINNTTGVSNSFFGVNAGRDNTTGYYNTFVGLNSGLTNTEGYFNSFIGMHSGYQNTSGFYNSFFGFQAGYTNTTGNNNTIIGTYANVSSNNLTFATAIGAYSTVNTNNTIALGRADGSDKVVVYGLGSGGITQLCRNAANQISNCSSSLRYKTNIKPFNFGLQVVNQLQPITFNWKGNGLLDLGFAAEELAKINPLLVNYNKNGEIEGVKYDRISTVLVNAVKEQQAEIEKLEQKVKSQQETIEAMKEVLCQIKSDAKLCK